MKRNGGFSLVELMIAMVIGLVIVLGAGQLFMTVFQTNRQVETLSEKQAAVNFAVETLLRDVRRASNITQVGGGLSVTVPNRGDITSGCGSNDSVVKTYRISADEVRDGDGWALEMSQGCNTPSPDYQQVVAALTSNGFEVDGSFSGDGVWGVTLELIATDNSGSPDLLVFRAVNRTEATN
ncbi:PilW family protein [Franzmannia qiaohouensis]|uniref:Prepilin-type N-terminal cleavage/methylation domain-containing protein n=1 Tax=Franzmannia qiaohouensis TaxID=1329370 RepID=A0ABU1HK51_9GAMM|nr:prepilin-type N-terminal cleavage/methylation domain-containing protein [Halomonas qiaohouensis]MDR5907154.1 prepilin-type N-terminal cleavage/methylation domain-containing protein [Halomonas qiaohouensis]